MSNNLFSYNGLAELRTIQKGTEVVPFVFAETVKQLEDNSDVLVDITSLVNYLKLNSADIYSAYNNIRIISKKAKIIAEKSVANDALELLPLAFNEVKSFVEEKPEIPNEDPFTFSWLRQKVYIYNNRNDLDRIIQYAKENSIPIATFSQVSGIAKDEFECFNRTKSLALMDLTSISYAIENNKSLIYLLESLLNIYPNIRVVSETSQVDNLLAYFPLYFAGQAPIVELIPSLDISITDDQQLDDYIIRITDFSKEKFEKFINDFNQNLIGHNCFKSKFKHALKNFIPLNKVKDQKVFSVFLYGASGIGKTEVARLIAEGLKEKSYLAKINFQNYSSQDALNSLIGSPSGYIGCDHGELSDKIKKSDVGILLCDEFEKATRPVFSFFLELLEEGRFTDSMAREYDLDGYIIVFTSNIQTESEYKRTIPPELQTRFDLVCEFEQPNSEEKHEFITLLLQKAKNKYAEYFTDAQITDEEEQELLNIDCSGITSLRDIKRIFNNRLIDLFEKDDL